MSDLVAILEERFSSTHKDLDEKLYCLAQKIISETEEHQKRVIKIMPEYDLHDNVHLIKVEQNIVKLIGPTLLHELSSLEIFLLLLASRLHDCGMAPADWELKLMSLTEGNEKFSFDKDSCCHDGKMPMNTKVAKEFIISKKDCLYNDFSKIKDWLFSPLDEESLISALVESMIRYQNYRNGFSSELAKFTNLEDFCNYNQNIRIDYIRLNHHKKTFEYVKNLSKLFETYLGEVWSQRLLHDLARICQAHGESIDFLKTLKTSVKYIDDTDVNPQFIAVLLRLGDIIHYSCDRAPSVLRTAMNFHSDYSKQEWAVKVGLSYTINNGTISFIANCQSPKDYYHLHKYIDWIDEEINVLDTLKRNWEPKYKIDILEVDRNNVDYDTSVFTPVNGKGFTLSQNKIITLLMGVNLYKDPFSCIRELYQNSLDACRCRIALNSNIGQNTKGNIEFGIIEVHGSKCLYCKDNGLGMTKSIIENYLLKIGNSFYQSADFSRKRAQWGSLYTPVSQFGIGILSCFIIGTKLEIVTRSYDTRELTICCIDGVHENVYYKIPTREEEESIEDCGTIVKVYLSSEYSSKINNLPIQKLGLVLQYDYDHSFTGKFSSYNDLFHSWKDNLYNYLNNYVNSVPNGIELNVRFANDTTIPIFNKPFPIIIGEYGITEQDKDFIDEIVANHYLRRYNGSMYGIQNYLKSYPIEVVSKSITYNTILILPLPGMKDLGDELAFFRHLYVRGSNISVDGITASARVGHDNMYYRRLELNGNINYNGAVRPQLSVDRKEIVSYPCNYKQEYKEITEKEIAEIINTAIYHIEKYNLSNEIETVKLIWKYLFDRIGCGQVLFVNKLAKSSLGSFNWPQIDQMLDSNTEIKDIMAAERVVFHNYNHKNQDLFTQKVVMALTIGAKSIEVYDENTIAINKGLDIEIPEVDTAFDHSRYLVPCLDSEIFKEYDIISNLYPIVPRKLSDALFYVEKRIANRNAIIVPGYTNCYNELFFQDSRLVNPSVGLYNAKRRFGNEKEHYIHDFDTLKSNFQCMDFIPNYWDKKEVVPILAYIAPSSLTDRDQELLFSYKETEPDYYKGVIEGWTVLVTNMETENVIIKPGKVSRDKMVSSLSEDFWTHYKEWTFRFLDGTIMTR